MVDHSLFKYNILFEDDEITPSGVSSRVNHESSVVLDSYTFHNNPLWYEDPPPPKMEISFWKMRVLSGKDYDEKKGGISFSLTSSWCVPILNGMTNDFTTISSHTYENIIDEIDLRDTFLCYQFK